MYESILLKIEEIQSTLKKPEDLKHIEVKAPRGEGHFVVEAPLLFFLLLQSTIACLTHFSNSFSLCYASALSSMFSLR